MEPFEYFLTFVFGLAIALTVGAFIIQAIFVALIAGSVIGVFFIPFLIYGLITHDWNCVGFLIPHILLASLLIYGIKYRHESNTPGDDFLALIVIGPVLIFNMSIFIAYKFFHVIWLKPFLSYFFDDPHNFMNGLLSIIPLSFVTFIITIILGLIGGTMFGVGYNIKSIYSYIIWKRHHPKWEKYNWYS